MVDANTPWDPLMLVINALLSEICLFVMSIKSIVPKDKVHSTLTESSNLRIWSLIH